MKYRVELEARLSDWVIVEADSPEEAVHIAKDEAAAGGIIIMGGEPVEWEWDGTPVEQVAIERIDDSR